MPRPWQRIASCAAAALLALLLSGCEVRGTVDVRSGTEAVADLVFTEAEVDCLGLTRYAGLVIKGIPESDGHQTCRAQGTLDLAALKDFGIQLTQAGEYLMVDLALPSQIAYQPLKVDIAFPGTVLDPGGLTVTGNSVRLGNASGGSDTSPITVIALSHPGPQWWVTALAGGLVGGVVLTLISLLLLRRGRRPGIEAQADAASSATDDTAPRIAASTTGESRTTIEAARTGPAGRGPAGLVPAELAPERDYHALFAPPPPGTMVAAAPVPDPSPPAIAPAVAADHTIWAPPEDRGDR